MITNDKELASVKQLLKKLVKEIGAEKKRLEALGCNVIERARLLGPAKAHCLTLRRDIKRYKGDEPLFLIEHWFPRSCRVEKLVTIRVENGMSQAVLAKRIGVGIKAFAQMDKKRLCDMQPNVLKAIAIVLDRQARRHKHANKHTDVCRSALTEPGAPVARAAACPPARAAKSHC